MTAINMAARWSSENVVAEHRDLQANAMAVDCTGQFVLLAGRRYLAIVDLDEPLETVKKIPRQSKWEVGAAEWNPNPSQANLFAIACNQRAELITWKESELASIHTLRSHTRVISDLNWSPFDPHLLATCSIDTYMYIWDVRDPRKPAVSLSAVAGATQIKWNKVTGNLLATAHEGDIRLWDHRKTTIPMQYIAAHLAKIHGLDWSPTQEYQLATSSQDCTVKFWDVTNPRRPEHVLQSDSPVWRARYTPFGEGLITVVVPQLRRGENSLLLWNTSNLNSHVHTFVGHTDVVLEFEWRSQKEEHRDFQLVTWSKDQSLRIWKIDSQLQKLCGHEVDLMDGTDTDLAAPLNDVLDAVDNTSQTSQTSPRDHDITLVPTGHVNSSVSAEQHSEQSEIILPSQPKNLQQEFSLVNINIPKVTVDEMDAVKRTCTVSAMSGKLVVRLLMTFPSVYPCNAVPTFQFCKGTTVDSSTKNKLLKVLRNTSQQHVKRNRSCLEPCLRQLISTLDNMSQKEGPDINNFYGLDSSRASFLPPTNRYGIFQDVTVPFPRTSGANFCGAGYLVCFAPPTHMKRMAISGEITPRSLSALAAFVSNPMQSISHPSQQNLIYPSVAQSPTGETGMLVSSYYYADRKQRFRGRSRKDGDSQNTDQKSSKAGLAVIYDVASLMSVNKELAETYVFDHKDISGMCTRNATAASAVGRKDLVQVWSMAALSASVMVTPNSDPDAGLPWAQHPFGRKLLQSLIDHYLKIRDIQTVAMLCCAFGPRNDSQPLVKKPSRCIADTATYSHTGKWWLKPGGSPYHTIHPGDTTMEGWNLSTLLKTNRSNSWSDSLDDHDFHFLTQSADSKDNNCEKHDTNIRLLDPKQVHRYDEFKRAYAEILYHWNLLQARSDLLKYVSTVPEQHRGVEFLTECLHCKSDVRGAYCSHCKNYSFQCAICHIAVKGSSNFCLACGHGGHTNHMEKWFIHHEYCPVGCGCYCLQESEIFGS